MNQKTIYEFRSLFLGGAHSGGGFRVFRIGGTTEQAGLLHLVQRDARLAIEGS